MPKVRHRHRRNSRWPRSRWAGSRSHAPCPMRRCRMRSSAPVATPPPRLPMPMPRRRRSDMSENWKPTACVICSLNCGLEVQTEGGKITRIRADKNHPVSQGYLCEKAQRMDAYQQGRDRLSSPMRRRPDGSYEAIDWDTAIAEVAARLAAVRDAHGGEGILFYGGGGEGEHLARG